jgi:mitogen-activated protein kinase 1/3
MSRVYLVLEQMDTDLGHVLARHQWLLIDHVRHFAYQLKALKFMHSGNVVHRDLKPSNLFVNSDLTLKVGDFGLAQIVGHPRDLICSRRQF